MAYCLTTDEVTMDRTVFRKALTAILVGIKACCEKQLCDFLKEGKFSSAPKENDARSTSKSHLTNLASERHFGSLDASQHRRRNASLHYHSSIIMIKASHKQMLEWIKRHKDRDQLWLKARKMGQVLRTKHKEAQNKQVKIISEEIDTVLQQRAQKALKKAVRMQRSKMSQSAKKQKNKQQCKPRKQNSKKQQCKPRKQNSKKQQCKPRQQNSKKQSKPAKTVQPEPAWQPVTAHVDDWIGVAYENLWYPGM